MPAKCLCNIVNRAQAFLYVCTGTHVPYQCRKTWLQGTERELGHPISHGFVNIVMCLLVNVTVLCRMSNTMSGLQQEGPSISHFALNSMYLFYIAHVQVVNLRRTYSAPSWSKSASSGKWLIWEHTPLFTPEIDKKEHGDHTQQTTRTQNCNSKRTVSILLRRRLIDLENVVSWFENESMKMKR